MEDHQEELHNKHLQRMCRLCGGLVLTQHDVQKRTINTSAVTFPLKYLLFLELIFLLM